LNCNISAQDLLLTNGCIQPVRTRNNDPK
jgi:hypothetical protein